MKLFQLATAIVFFTTINLVHAIENNTVLLDGKKMRSIADALKNAVDASIIEIGPGIFKDGGTLKANYVTIIGSPGTHLQGFASKGKGTLIIKGNNTEISNIECSKVNVKDKNGACIRLEGKNLQLRSVFFHDAQQGILTGRRPGRVIIEKSRFENLGKAGRAHGIYIGGGELLIHDSLFLSSKDQGHEIKSRAAKTTISKSTIASLSGVDSRLVDVPNGGELIVSNCVLQQGNNTSNWNLIGYGLEGIKHKANNVTIKNNFIILDRTNGSRIFQSKGKVERVALQGNVIVGKYTDKGMESENYIFKSRETAGLKVFPFLPKH